MYNHSFLNRYLRSYFTLAVASGILAIASVACASGPPPIVFTSDRDGNLEIYSVDSRSAKEVNLTNSPEDESSPVVSPNGKLVAFRAGSGKNNSIEVISTRGESRQQMTQKGGIHRDQR